MRMLNRAKTKRNTISLKVAARRFLRWNLKGLEIVTPRRGVWIEDYTQDKAGKTKTCVACKIGLVMIGRYGLTRAASRRFGPSYSEDNDLLEATLDYGPQTECPVASCDHSGFSGSWELEGPIGHFPLGVVVEHLFEKHKKSVMWIDSWLGVLADG